MTTEHRKPVWNGLAAVAKLFEVSPGRAQKVVADIDAGSTPAFGYYALISTATLIASLGLVLNSVAVVIGAMLVSPLMTPIFGLALGMVRGNGSLLARSVRAEVGGVVLAVLFGTVFGLLPFTVEVTPEMLSRTSPNLLDLLVALFAGLAGSFAMLDERISPALPGVAISTAIVPPLSTCGLCLAVGAFEGAYGAFLLFFANFLTILLVAAGSFLLGGLGEIHRQEHKKLLLRRLVVAGASFMVVAALLTHSLVNMVSERRQSLIIRQTLEDGLSGVPYTALDKVMHEQVGDKLYVLALVRSPRPLAPDRVADLEQRVTKVLHSKDVDLVVRCSLVRDVSATGSTSAVVARNLDGKFIDPELDPGVERIQNAEQALREIFASQPNILLVDVNHLPLAGESVIIATLQASRPLTPYEVSQLEDKVRKRLDDPKVRLMVRSERADMVTSKGRVLYGGAHFGARPAGAARLEDLTTRAIDKLGDFVVSSLDAVPDGKTWAVRAEVVGPRVILPGEVKQMEASLSKEAGKPVKLVVWSKVELVATGGGWQSREDYTVSQLKDKKSLD